MQIEKTIVGGIAFLVGVLMAFFESTRTLSWFIVGFGLGMIASSFED